MLDSVQIAIARLSKYHPVLCSTSFIAESCYILANILLCNKSFLKSGFCHSAPQFSQVFPSYSSGPSLLTLFIYLFLWKVCVCVFIYYIFFCRTIRIKVNFLINGLFYVCLYVFIYHFKSVGVRESKIILGASLYISVCVCVCMFCYSILGKHKFL